MNTFHVYIMTNRSRTLYTGVTNDLERRVYQHKVKETAGFTSRYNITRLAFYEAFPGIVQAIEREKQIKGWSRIRKIRLIEEQNPQWLDLAADWFDDVMSKQERRHPERSEGSPVASKVNERSFGLPQDDISSTALTAQLPASAARHPEHNEESPVVGKISERSFGVPQDDMVDAVRPGSRGR